MQYREEDRETLDQLKNVPVYSAVTSRCRWARWPISRSSGPRSIERENHRVARDRLGQRRHLAARRSPRCGRCRR